MVLSVQLSLKDGVLLSLSLMIHPVKPDWRFAVLSTADNENTALVRLSSVLHSENILLMVPEGGVLSYIRSTGVVV